MFCLSYLYVFFFKQKTAYEMRISDWSSDVCSSDLALQLVYLEMRQDVEKALKDGSFTTDNGERLARRALANYAAAAMIMPYAPFARAVEARRYDVEAISRQFGTSFEQTAHRLTTLQKPGHERVPFFFIKVDPAGNVRSEEHTSELQSLMRISYAVFCLKKKNKY